jgi:F0F1-type ATP synthase membrane subunit a
LAWSLRDTVILPNVGKKWGTWAPLILTFFFFILANLIGLIRSSTPWRCSITPCHR